MISGKIQENHEMLTMFNIYLGRKEFSTTYDEQNRDILIYYPRMLLNLSKCKWEFHIGHDGLIASRECGPTPHRDALWHSRNRTPIPQSIMYLACDHKFHDPVNLYYKSEFVSLFVCLYMLQKRKKTTEILHVAKGTPSMVSVGVAYLGDGVHGGGKTPILSM